MTPYEIAQQKLVLTKQGDLVVPPEATEILDIISLYQVEPHQERWVQLDLVFALMMPPKLIQSADEFLVGNYLYVHVAVHVFLCYTCVSALCVHAVIACTVAL